MVSRAGWHGLHQPSIPARTEGSDSQVRSKGAVAPSAGGQAMASSGCRREYRGGADKRRGGQSTGRALGGTSACVGVAHEMMQQGGAPTPQRPPLLFLFPPVMYVLCKAKLRHSRHPAHGGSWNRRLLSPNPRQGAPLLVLETARGCARRPHAAAVGVLEGAAPCQMACCSDPAGIVRPSLQHTRRRARGAATGGRRGSSGWHAGGCKHGGTQPWGGDCSQHRNNPLLSGSHAQV